MEGFLLAELSGKSLPQMNEGKGVGLYVHGSLIEALMVFCSIVQPDFGR
jgi:hypothetical protein